MLFSVVVFYGYIFLFLLDLSENSVMALFQKDVVLGDTI